MIVTILTYLLHLALLGLALGLTPEPCAGKILIKDVGSYYSDVNGFYYWMEHSQR